MAFLGNSELGSLDHAVHVLLSEKYMTEGALVNFELGRRLTLDKSHN